MITRGQPFRILLVDDDHMCRSVTVHLLEACGYEVVAVADGRAAVAAAVREPFALVLMDIMMPEMDGYEAVALIRERERPGDARLPVVALTGFSGREDREGFLAAGFDDCLSKPADMETLRETIERNARTVSQDAWMSSGSDE